MPKRRTYLKCQMDLAISDVLSGSSYRSVAKKYGIPKSSIEFKIKNPGHKETFGPSTVLTLEEENNLVKWIHDLARKGFPRKAEDIKSSVQIFLTSNARKNPFTNNRPGSGWMKAFLKRHPDVSVRTSEAVTSASACVSEQDIRKWFLEIIGYFKEKEIEDILNDPARVFNGDETGFQICPATGKVFAGKGTKNVYSVDHGSSKENITVMFTFSANGAMCCPMIVYPYQRIPEKISKSVNPQWGIGRSENGWMTAETFYQYIGNVFHPYLIENSVTFPVVLFVDGHKSHLTYELSTLCNSLQIELIALYPNATRILQPADVAVFRPIKIGWRKAVREWQSDHPGDVLNRVSFAPLLEKVIEECVKPETLINGFRACGLYPLNPDAIDYSKCLGVIQNNSNEVNGSLPAATRVMNYQTFLDIIGPDKLERFKSLEAVFPDEIDDNCFDLFRIWKHFQTYSKVNILQNLIVRPATETTIQHNFAGKESVVQQPEINKDILSKSPINETCNRTQSPVAGTSRTKSSISAVHVPKVVQSPLLGEFLIMPETPQRKGKKNIERFPFAITSKKYQDMFELKRVLKEEEDRKKDERKRKREETKLKNYGKKKGKGKENQEICHACCNKIKSKELRCDDCYFCFHTSCIPKTHKKHIPDEDDKFLCHNCYKEESDSDEALECHDEPQAKDNEGNYFDDDDHELIDLFTQEMKKY